MSCARDPRCRGSARTTILLGVLVMILGVITLQQWGFSEPKRRLATRRREATVGVEELTAALQGFCEDHGRWPAHLYELITPPRVGAQSYMQGVHSLKDPACPSQANEYYYSLSGEEVIFGSLGSDARLGGKGYAEDILVKLSVP